MYRCTVTYQVGRISKYVFQHQTKEYPETISEATWSNIIQLERGYKKHVKIIEVLWKEGIQIPQEKPIPNPSMKVIHVKSVQDRIAQLTRKGLYPQQISRELSEVTKPELVSVIMEYQSQE